MEPSGWISPATASTEEVGEPGRSRGEWMVAAARGIVFSVLGITPFNLIERMQQLVSRIIDLGFDAFRSAFTYFLLGAVVVITVWFVVRLLRLGLPRDRR